MRVLFQSLIPIILAGHLAFASFHSNHAGNHASKTVNIQVTQDWGSPKQPSNLLKWTVDPDHAWWKRHLLEPRNPKVDNTPPATPTKCTWVPATTEPSCPQGCICSSSGCASIWFTNMTRAEPRPFYHVCTSWKLNHQHQIRAGLEQAGFQRIGKPVRCGWQKLKFVMELRVGRGSIDVNGTEELPWGDMAEVAVIERVLKREYPFIEILIILATLVGPIIGSFCLCGWCMVLGVRNRGSGLFMN
jgi:hypothetical protein